ncbi:hypothetical protein RJ55_03774 [Drechmeria coniospora]|nr:hypothetical protein RJ55_03774 [Drechmeria coniospora]
MQTRAATLLKREAEMQYSGKKRAGISEESQNPPPKRLGLRSQGREQQDTTAENGVSDEEDDGDGLYFDPTLLDAVNAKAGFHREEPFSEKSQGIDEQATEQQLEIFALDSYEYEPDDRQERLESESALTSPPKHVRVEARSPGDGTVDGPARKLRRGRAARVNPETKTANAAMEKGTALRGAADDDNVDIDSGHDDGPHARHSNDGLCREGYADEGMIYSNNADDAIPDSEDDGHVDVGLRDADQAEDRIWDDLHIMILDSDVEKGGKIIPGEDGRNEPLHFVHIQSEPLPSMLLLMGLRGWTAESKGYADKLLRRPLESNDEWWMRNEEFLENRMCETLYRRVQHIASFYQRVPRAPDFEAQAEHIRLGHDDIQDAVLDGCKLKPSSPTTTADEKEQRSLAKEDDNRKLLRRRRDTFHETLEEARTRLGGRTGASRQADEEVAGIRHRQEAQARSAQDELGKTRTRLQMEREELIRTERMVLKAEKERARKAHEKREAQLQRFMASARRILDGRMKNGPWERQSQEERYLAKHGWHLWEDERLLDKLKDSKSPPIHALSHQDLEAVMPQRSLEEIAKRVSYLRNKMRLLYEVQKQEPPWWCSHGSDQD